MSGIRKFFRTFVPAGRAQVENITTVCHTVYAIFQQPTTNNPRLKTYNRITLYPHNRNDHDKKTEDDGDETHLRGGIPQGREDAACRRSRRCAVNAQCRERLPHLRRIPCREAFPLRHNCHSSAKRDTQDRPRRGGERLLDSFPLGDGRRESAA